MSAMFDGSPPATTARTPCSRSATRRSGASPPRGPSRPQPGERILDVAAGTGTSSASLAKSGASVVAADFSPGMIEVGRRRQVGVPNLDFVEADATKLPFDDDEFDAVTISFGLRNVNEPKLALAEMFRVAQARRPPRDLRVLAPARRRSCGPATTPTSAT